MPVLVLDSHCRAGIEAIQSLGRAGLEIDVAAESLECVAMRSRYASRKLTQPSTVVPEEFHAWLRAQHQQRAYELVVPSTEASLMALRLLPEYDPLRIRAVLPSNKALDVAIDKYQTWQLAKDLGVRTPNSVVLTRDGALDSPPAYPSVVKPLRSKVMVDGKLQNVEAVIAHDEQEYRNYVNRFLPYTSLLRQECVHGRGIGAEFLFDRGKKVWHFMHERLHEMPLTGGASSYRRSIAPIPQLLNDAEKMLTALDWHGVAMVEFRVDEQGEAWLLEINPRLWGSLALAIDAGVDFPLGLWLLAQGRELPSQPAYRTPFYTRDLRSDVEWFNLRLRAKRWGLPSRFVSVIELLRPFSGRESWDHFDWRDPKVIGKVLADTVDEQAHGFWLYMLNGVFSSFRIRSAVMKSRWRLSASRLSKPFRN